MPHSFLFVKTQRISLLVCVLNLSVCPSGNHSIWKDLLEIVFDNCTCPNACLSLCVTLQVAYMRFVILPQYDCDWNLDKRTISFHPEYILYAWQMTIDTIKAQDMFLLSHCSRAPLNWPFSRTCRKWSEPLKYIAMLERSCAVNTVIWKQMHQILIRLYRKTAEKQIYITVNMILTVTREKIIRNTL